MKDYKKMDIDQLRKEAQVTVASNCSYLEDQSNDENFKCLCPETDTMSKEDCLNLLLKK